MDFSSLVKTGMFSVEVQFQLLFLFGGSLSQVAPYSLISTKLPCVQRVNILLTYYFFKFLFSNALVTMVLMRGYSSKYVCSKSKFTVVIQLWLPCILTERNAVQFITKLTMKRKIMRTFKEQR